MNKKASFFLSDIFWFILFVVVAVFSYFFLFSTLKGHIANNVVVADTYVDADFAAESLLRMKVQLTYTSPYNGKPFATLAAATAKAYKENPSSFKETPEYKAYAQFVTNVFSDPAFEGRNYAVYLRVANENIIDTCGEFPHTNFLCNDVRSGNTVPDPKSGLQVPAFDSSHTSVTDTGGLTIPEEYTINTQIGSAYVPSESGAVIVHVVEIVGVRHE